MTAKLYYTFVNKSYRQMRQNLSDKGIDYVKQQIDSDPLTWEQLLEILMYTDNGIEDILSPKSLDYTELIAQGVDFDNLTLTQFHELTKTHPKIIRTPILVVKGNTFIGYAADEMTVLNSREERKAGYSKVLKTLQLNDTVDMGSEVIVY